MPNVKKDECHSTRYLGTKLLGDFVSVDGPIDLFKRVRKWDHKAHSCTAYSKWGLTNAL